MKHEYPGKRFFARWESIGERIVEPFQSFLALETSGGMVLVAMTAVALIWANSDAADWYYNIFHLEFRVFVGERSFGHNVHFLLNEGLMTIFFLVVGLEIKRELLVGELASARKAALPVLAAAGGALVPALIYYVMNEGTPAERGWGIPMATDIAFVVGALAVLGSRVPASLAVFLVSVAIVDDVISVVVIAVFYTADISVHFLGLAGVALGLLGVLNLLGFRHPFPYVVGGFLVWVFMFQSGVHPTMAGVLIALAFPSRSKTDTLAFAEHVGKLLGKLKPACEKGDLNHLCEANESVVRALETLCVSVQPPLQRLEHLLHPWVVFLIMPLFALGNAGIKIQWNEACSALGSHEGLGIVLGLFVGKQIGICSTVWLAVKAGLADLPEDLSFRHVHAGAVLCGIGFTMSLFIADLSLGTPALLDQAKLAILAGSSLSAVIGMGLLHHFTRKSETSRSGQP